MCEQPFLSRIKNIEKWERRPNLDRVPLKPKMLNGIFKKQNLGTWSENKWNDLRRVYLGMVHRLDYHLGLIIDTLKEINEYDNTTLFAYSDHGDYTGDYGIVEKAQNTFDDCVSKVPLVIKPSKQYEVKPRISSSLVELNDLSATIEELAGIELSYTQYGKSLVPLLVSDLNLHEFVICEGGRNLGEIQAMEKGHTEASPYWPRLSTQGEENGAHEKSIMMRFKEMKYVYRQNQEDELYDMIHDPMELKNLIHDEKYKDFVNEAKIKLMEFMVKTCDFVPKERDLR